MKSIRKQMFVYLVLGVLVVFFVFGIWMNITVNELPEYAASQYREMAQARADELSKELQGFVDLVLMTAQTDVVKSMDLDRIKPYLKSAVLTSKIRNMTVSDLNGKAWATYDREIDISKQEQYKRIILGGESVILSEPFWSPYIEETFPIVTIASAVENEGKTVGLVNAVVSTQFLDQVVRRIEFRKTGFAWIVDQEGKVVSHPDYDITIETPLTDLMKEPEAVAKLLKSKSGTQNYTCMDGVERIAIYSDIEASNGWKLIMSVAQADAYSEINSIKWNMNLMYGAMVLLVSGFAFFYSRSLSDPIMKLKTVFEKAAAGNLNVRADETVKNEIGMAGKSFNTMIQQLKRLTYRDPVTQIYNFNRFMFEIENRLDLHRERMALSYIVVLSIDDFSRLNSIGGHDTGSLALKSLAEKLIAFIRVDEVVASYFGDEMILLLSDEDEFQMSKRVERLLEISSGEMIIKGIQYTLDVSAGVNLIPPDLTDPTTMIQRAKIAKLMTKKLDGNRFVIYNEALHDMVKREQFIEEALHHSVERGEFTVVYQPIVDAKTHEVYAHEALLRWQNTAYGQVAIPYIIELAEKTGDILEIGRFVLEAACRQNLNWVQQHTYDGLVSVNVSSLQFEDFNFVASVKEVLKVTGMPPERLEIEITETNAMLNVEDKISKLRELKELGIKIAVDDFGTGYSSLSYFTQFPIDTLKIDKSFVDDMMRDENALAIVSMIVNMAKTMRIKTTAEGVETKDQYNKLLSMGVDRIQGYWISKPGSPEQLPSKDHIKGVFED